MIEIGLRGQLQPLSIRMSPSEEIDFYETAKLGEKKEVELEGEDSFGNKMYLRVNLHSCLYVALRTDEPAHIEKTEHEAALELLARAKR